jgi:hypothetical protein
MKTKNILILFAVILSCSAAIIPIANPQSKWSEKLEDKKGLKLHGIIARDQNSFYTLHYYGDRETGFTMASYFRTYLNSLTLGMLGLDPSQASLMSTWGTKTELVLKHFGNNLVEKNSKEIDLTMGRKKRFLERITEFGGALRMFSSYTDKDAEKSYLFVETIDLKALDSKRDIQKVTEVSFNKKTKKQINNSTYNFVMSRDSSKLLIFSNLPNKDKDNELFTCTVLNEKFQVLWQRKIEIPYADKLFAIKDFTLSNNGDVYVLGKLFADKVRDVKHNNINFKHQVIGFKKNGNDKSIYDINLPNKFITDMRITINNSDNLICAGFYAITEEGKKQKQKTYRTVDGIYNLVIDGNTKNIITNNTEDFDKDFYLQNLTDRGAKKAKKKLDKGKDADVLDFDIDNLIIKEDGGVVMVGEQYRMIVDEVQMTNGDGTSGGSSIVYHYMYNEILIVNIKPTGEIDWYKRIPKFQHTTNDGGYFSSYSLMVQKDKLHFFYNDHVDNISFKDNKGKRVNWSNKPKKTVIMCTTVTNEGKMNRIPIANAKSAEIMMRPFSCDQLSSEQFLLYGEKGHKAYKFALITP